MTGARERPGAAIEVADLWFAYPDSDRPALAGVSLTVQRGERVAVLGPNGAGKSTLCLHLNGILRGARGTVAIGGLPLDDASVAEVRRRVGLVFQDPDDMLFMPTVAQDIAFGPANLGLPPGEVAARVDRALALVGMVDARQRPPHHLSVGQRKRVAAAAVLAMDPQVLVLDEPSANLDPRSRREFGALVADLDLTVVLVTHDLPYAAELCARAVVLNGGRVVADGPVVDILSDDALLAEHDLELPAGFDLDVLARSGARRRPSGAVARVC